MRNQILIFIILLLQLIQFFVHVCFRLLWIYWSQSFVNAFVLFNNGIMSKRRNLMSFENYIYLNSIFFLFLLLLNEWTNRSMDNKCGYRNKWILNHRTVIESHKIIYGSYFCLLLSIKRISLSSAQNHRLANKWQRLCRNFDNNKPNVIRLNHEM